ncbi:MAG: hypothetical protein IJS37_04320 [Bacilli bacterium]|nr:hypothetical protein [Bacilli bacterium]
MSQLKKYPFVYLAALCAILAFGFFFLADVYCPTAEGTPIYVYGFTLAFGGELQCTIGESVYSLAFSINIFALVLLMCLFLSAVAALLSKESVINRAVACALAIAGGVLMFILPSQVGQMGLRYAYGAFLCAGFAFGSALFDILAFFIRPKKA